MWLLLACAPSPEEILWSYPLDDVLRVNHVQSVGTHNSYHMRTAGIEVDAWNYEHAALDVQLEDQGVRQFELDIWWDEAEGDFGVYHVPIIDPTSTCGWLSDCVEVLRAWSDANPAHHPFLTLLELKDDYDEATAPRVLEAIDDILSASWPVDRRISPDDVQRDAASLAEGLAADGWPTLGEVRGRAIFVLHTGGDFRAAYTDGNTQTAGRVMFPDGHGELDLAVGAIDTLNDPVGDAEAIAAALAAGHLVRTRTDSDGDQARANDTTQRDAGLASGAHFLSTDFPIPYAETGYVVSMPGGTPSRCNPVLAPAECTSEAIEDPSWIQGN